MSQTIIGSRSTAFARVVKDVAAMSARKNRPTVKTPPDGSTIHVGRGYFMCPTD